MIHVGAPRSPHRPGRFVLLVVSALCLIGAGPAEKHALPPPHDAALSSASTSAQDAEVRAQTAYYDAETRGLAQTYAFNQSPWWYVSTFAAVIVAALAGAFALMQFGPSFRLSVQTQRVSAQTQRDNLLFEAAKRLGDSNVSARVGAAALLIVLVRRADKEFRESVVLLLLAALEAETDPRVIVAIEQAFQHIEKQDRSPLENLITPEYSARRADDLTADLARFMEHHRNDRDVEWKLEARREASSLSHLTEEQLQRIMDTNEYKVELSRAPADTPIEELRTALISSGRKALATHRYRPLRGLTTTPTSNVAA